MLFWVQWQSPANYYILYLSGDTSKLQLMKPTELRKKCKTLNMLGYFRFILPAAEVSPGFLHAKHKTGMKKACASQGRVITCPCQGLLFIIILSSVTQIRMGYFRVWFICRFLSDNVSGSFFSILATFPLG